MNVTHLERRQSCAFRIAKLGLSFGGVMLALLIAEIATRVVGGGETSMTRGMFCVFDSEAGKRCRPDSDLRFVRTGSFDVRVKCSSQGLRDVEHPFAKPAGVRRIVCLGDSFLWGWGVENSQMLSTVLARELAGARSGVETINLGVAGYSSVQELARLESDGLAYEPDWTLVLFCDNDLEGNFEDKEADRPLVDLRDDDVLHVINRPVRETWGMPIVRFLHAHSRLVHEVYYSLSLLREKRKAQRTRVANTAALPPAVSPPAGPKPERSARPVRTARLRSKDMQFSSVDRFLQPDERIDQAWRTLGQIYAAMKAQIEQRGGRMIAAYAPEMALVEDASFRRLVAEAGIPLERADWDRPQRRFEQLCAELSIPCANLIREFRGAKLPASLFLNGDPHWNAAGHALAAKCLASRLRELDESLR
jgi:lysophospholipase L1-like esterase